MPQNCGNGRGLRRGCSASLPAGTHCPGGLCPDDTCTPNVFIQEQSLGIHYNQGSDLLDYLADKSVFAYENGFTKILDGPGLGIAVNEELVQEVARKGHNWKNPIWRNYDGTVAEW